MTQLSETTQPENDPLYRVLLEHDGGRDGGKAIARILTSWHHDDSVLPAWLGLKDAAEFQRFLNWYFPTMTWPDESLLRMPLSSEQLAEQDDLLDFMLNYRVGKHTSEFWMAEIIAAACLGSDHLWRDLGLWSRDDLTELIALYFPSLAELNNQNMKWKKFLYRQLCMMDGSYTCRSPSCEVCIDYGNCFGPEE